MLVLSRKVGERIVIGNDVEIVINRISGNRVSVGVVAPDEVKIVRGELKPIVDDFPESEPSPVASLASQDFSFNTELALPRSAR